MIEEPNCCSLQVSFVAPRPCISSQHHFECYGCGVALGGDLEGLGLASGGAAPGGTGLQNGQSQVTLLLCASFPRLQNGADNQLSR